MIQTSFVPATRTAPAPYVHTLLSSVLLSSPPILQPIPTVPPARRPLRLALSFVLAALTGVAVAVALAFVASTVLGYQHFTVMSGSMEPVISTGDVVVDKRIAPVDARIGDVVTFRDPVNDKRLISHRVTAMRVGDGTVFFTTKGDANNDVQKWTAPVDGRIGRVELDLPKVGYLLFFLGKPWGRLGLVVLPLLILGAYEVRQIWRGPESDGEQPARSKPSGSHSARHAKRA